jgi:hypothetical protein
LFLERFVIDEPVMKHASDDDEEGEEEELREESGDDDLLTRVQCG